MDFDPVKMTQELVRIPSITPEDLGVQDVMIQYLDHLGFETTKLPFEGRGSYPVENFFSTLKRGDGPHFCYSGHTDVVPPGDLEKWSYPPFDAYIDGDLMYGRGTSDMKAANAAMVVAAKNFLDKNPDFGGAISFAITGDEEAERINGSKRIAEWMIENNQKPDVVFIGESSNAHKVGEEIKIGRRGVFAGVLSIEGIQAHVAYPHKGDNPIPRMATIIDVLSAHKFDDGNEFFPATGLQFTSVDVGNPADNVIPGKITAAFSIRFNNEWDKEKLEDAVRALIDPITSHYDLKIRCEAESYLTDKNDDFIRLVQGSVQAVTGQSPVLSTQGGASDGCYFAHYCPVLEYGLINKSIHKIDEHLNVNELKQLVTIYEEILTRFFKK